MTNIVLATPSSIYPPVGVLYVADALEKAGYDVMLLSVNAEDDDFLACVQAQDPVFVGFSVNTYPSLTEVITKSRLVHDLGYHTVWGGNHASCLPWECWTEPYIDGVVVGDGEEGIVCAAATIASGRSLWMPQFVTDLDRFSPSWRHVYLPAYVFPSTHSIHSATDTHANRVFYYLSTSRGCPFSCGFCINSRTPKAPWRAHSAEWVIDQIEFLRKEANIDGIGFWDDFFFGNMARATKIINYLAENDIKFLCEARAKELDDTFVKYLKESGCLQLFVGAESGSDRVLEMIDKKLTVDDIWNAVELTSEYRLPLRLSFIIGFPGETNDEMEATWDLVTDVQAYDHVSVSGPKHYTPYPGTKLYQKALEYGFQPPETMEGWAKIDRKVELPWL